MPPPTKFSVHGSRKELAALQSAYQGPRSAFWPIYGVAVSVKASDPAIWQESSHSLSRGSGPCRPDDGEFLKGPQSFSKNRSSPHASRELEKTIGP